MFGLLFVLIRFDIVVEIIVMSSKSAPPRFRSGSLGGSLEGMPQYDHFVLRGANFSSESLPKSLQTLSSSELFSPSPQLWRLLAWTLLPSPLSTISRICPIFRARKDAHIRESLEASLEICRPFRKENQNSSYWSLNQQHLFQKRIRSSLYV